MEYPAHEEQSLVGLNASPVHTAMALLGSRRSAGCKEDPPSKMLIKNLLLFLIKTHRFHILGFIFSSSAVKSVSLKQTLLSVFTGASGIKSINLL